MGANRHFCFQIHGTRRSVSKRRSDLTHDRRRDCRTRNTLVDVRAGCAHCGSERVPGGAVRAWSGAGSLALAHFHCGPTLVSSRHMQTNLNTANCRQARHHRSRCAGAAMHGHRSAQAKSSRCAVALASRDAFDAATLLCQRVPCRARPPSMRAEMI